MRLISEALDIYTRLALGQIDAMKGPAAPIIRDWPKFYEMVDVFKEEAFDLAPGASFGIYQKNVSERARVAYDMHQVIRHELYMHLDDAIIPWTVDGREALQTSEQPLIKMKIAKKAP